MVVTPTGARAVARRRLPSTAGVEESRGSVYWKQVQSTTNPNEESTSEETACSGNIIEHCCEEILADEDCTLEQCVCDDSMAPLSKFQARLRRPETTTRFQNEPISQTVIVCTRISLFGRDPEISNRKRKADDPSDDNGPTVVYNRSWKAKLPRCTVNSMETTHQSEANNVTSVLVTVTPGNSPTLGAKLKAGTRRSSLRRL
ncbi:hypothetical protein KIN20_012364 [Parelaphostrongylus tenuis]|uniref:Uncharacterized protein n=1 Tax=Parelaphostrongylus tenuis TaxID=148309 RepID=A0AAD5N102_PARTN|nr:hypothetical protein KIN20_012364 [Parelaphostrongylus tenuis]